jgi:hypothetical protein
MKKVCRGTPQSPGCGRNLDRETRFYLHPNTADGFFSKCKSCVRKAALKRKRRLRLQHGAH